MSKQNNLKDYLTDLYEGISTKRPNASRNPQNFRAEIESIQGEKAKLQEKTLTANGVYPPDSGYDGFSKVTVDVAGKVLPKYDGEVIIEGEPESGGGGGGSAEFNIAYGDTAPSDTSKLWVKANEPEAVNIVTNTVFDSGITTLNTILPLTSHQRAAAKVGTKVYLFGGSNCGDRIDVYDTKSETITTIGTKLPTAETALAAVLIGTKVYLFGGGGTDNRIDVFDTISETISTLSAKLPDYSTGVSAAAVGTKVYLFACSSYGNKIVVFDTENETTTTLSTQLPSKASYASAVAIGTKVYLFGGNASKSTTKSTLNTINVYDTAIDVISTLNTTLPSPAHDIAAVAIGTKVYLFGGYRTATSPTRYNTINVFDSASETILTLDTKLPIESYGIAAVAEENVVYLFGGYSPSATLNTINVFTSSLVIEPNHLIIEAGIKKNSFNLLPNLEIGVNHVYLGNADGNGERVDAYLHNGTEWVEV